MRVALGFRVKTGRAVGLSLVETDSLPRVVARHDLELSHPSDESSRQPYHAALELSEPEGARTISRVTGEVKALGLRGLRAAVEEMKAAGYDLHGVGIVAGSLADPSRVANPHIRAHALEGKLFREALEEAARELGLPSITLVEKTQYEEAARGLGRGRAGLDAALGEMGIAAGRPWRGEQKSAALAAWVRLSSNCS
jgi:hypothetical protein